tara:strand:+ start:2085 stop:3080 length:996 start_codon:yes stop_codon:yes gene_type:complete
MQIGHRLGLLATLLFLASGCTTSSGGARAFDAALTSPLQEFQNKEARLYRIGYRLASSNASYCDRIEPTLGFLIHDASSYKNAASVREEFGLIGDIGVQAVAPGSPAAEVGLKQNDTLVAVDGQSIQSFNQDPDATWRRGLDIRREIAHSAQDGSVMIDWSSEGAAVHSVEVKAVDVCKSQVELLSGDSGALADGTRILVGDRFPGLAYSDDELAAVLAHEMAHNILGHIDFLVENGRSGGFGRNSERDADRLMPWLLANAGYDPDAATRMMQQYGPRHSGGIFRSRSHDGWDERVELIEEQVKEVKRRQSETGRATVDWSAFFKPLLVQN